MTNAEIIQFDDDVLRVQSDQDVKSLYSKYKHLDHPIFYNRFAQIYLQSYEDYDLARPYIIKCISYGLKHDNKFVNSISIDLITQSIQTFFDKEGLIKVEHEYKLAALSYVYLTKLIKSYGTNAYNSFENRGLLVSNSKFGVLQLLQKYYYDGPDLCNEMLSLGDFFSSHIGYKKESETENAARMLKSAVKDFEYIKSLPQYEKLSSVNLEGMAQLSLKNSEYLFQNLLKDFDKGIFDITDFS